jgi:hypothetical protein
MGEYYIKEKMDNEFKEALKVVKESLGIQSTANSIRRVLTAEELVELITYLNGK